MQVHPVKPDEFAAILIEKLEWIKRKQEAQEKLDRKLQEVGGLISDTAGGSYNSLRDKMTV
jgi:hypothetical protein